jgi:hypothetical protein
VQRDIGSPIDYDIFSVRNGTPPELILYPILSPANLATIRKENCEFVASFQEKSSEVDSAIVKVQVSWDGAWESGENEMKNHLKIEQLP